MDNIKRSIETAIAEHLPKQVGDVLQSELERLKQLEKDNSELKNQVDYQHGQIKSLTDRNKNQAELLARAGKINEREAAVQEKETNLEIAKLTHELSCEKASNQKVFDLVSLLFRNVDVRKELFKFKEHIYDNNGNFREDFNGNESETIVKE